jgi:hypothetical protein
VNFWVNKKDIHYLWGNEKLKKRCFTENFDSCIADKFVGPHLSDFTKKTRQVNKSSNLKGMAYKKWLCNFLRRGGMSNK